MPQGEKEGVQGAGQEMATLFVHVSVYATRANRQSWGDTQYAEGLLRAIRAVPGCDGGLLFRNETPPPTAAPAIVLRIIGPHPEDPVPGLPNILWMISPPNLSPAALLGRYQAVFCASDLFTRHLQAHGIAARYLPQATEPTHFHPDRRLPDTPDLPVVFVGAHAPRADRALVLHAIKAGHDVRIWGPGWQGVVPDHCLQGTRLDFDQLAQTYAAARVILNSHMPQMAERGYMSNRSFDALSCGAHVISDRIPGFAAAELPELSMATTPAVLEVQLAAALALPPADLAARRALHARVVEAYGFGARARCFVACARALLAEGRVAPAATVAMAQQRPAQPIGNLAPQQQAMLATAEQMLWLARPDAGLPPAPCPAAAEEIIHPLMADLREMQALTQAPPPLSPEARARVATLATGARRLVEALHETTPGLGLQLPPATRDSVLTRLYHDEPLWAHSPEGFHRDSQKAHLALRPRRNPAPPARPVGVFLHLYYDDLAASFAERLRQIDAPLRLYVSTDTEAKAARIAPYLPQAEIRVLPNRGRDIWAKLYGFADVYDRHDIVLHLHGKKSQHSHKLDAWLAHILDCLLGPRAEVNRILSIFQAIPSLGLITPLAYRNVLAAAHWGANRDIARELAHRMGLPGALPDHAELQFPIGSMFWGRVKAIRPLLNLRLTLDHFPPEAGQVDGTLAHAIERMLGVTCRAQGFSILPVCGPNQNFHGAFRHSFTSNRDLRAALDAQEFAPR